MFLYAPKKVSMTRKCHNHKPHNNLQHRKEEAHESNSDQTAITVKQPFLSSSASYCKTRKDTNTTPTNNGSNNNNESRTKSEPLPLEGTAADTTVDGMGGGIHIFN